MPGPLPPPSATWRTQPYRLRRPQCEHWHDQPVTPVLLQSIQVGLQRTNTLLYRLYIATPDEAAVDPAPMALGPQSFVGLQSLNSHSLRCIAIRRHCITSTAFHLQSSRVFEPTAPVRRKHAATSGGGMPVERAARSCTGKTLIDWCNTPLNLEALQGAYPTVVLLISEGTGRSRVRQPGSVRPQAGPAPRGVARGGPGIRGAGSDHPRANLRASGRRAPRVAAVGRRTHVLAAQSDFWAS